MTDGEDRRRYPRFNVKLGAKIDVSIAGVTYTGTARNLSVTGACVADFAQAPKVGDGDGVELAVDGLTARPARVVRTIGGFVVALDYGLDAEGEARSAVELQALLGEPVTFPDKAG